MPTPLRLEATASSRRPVAPPPRRLQRAEAWAPWEALASQLMPLPNWLIPVGEPQPVLIIPPFTGDDHTTAPLRLRLQLHGHVVYGWQLGQNWGPTPRIVSALRVLLDRISERHGRPISLVGASLGGIFARALAREAPDRVERVITLGSPFRALSGDRTAAQPLWDALKPLHVEDLVSFDEPEESRPPLTVPASAIYTKGDGIARWELCVEHEGVGVPGRRAENIEIYGTHTGLPANGSAAFAVLDRLAQPSSPWEPFQPPRALQGAFPRPFGGRPR